MPLNNAGRNKFLDEIFDRHKSRYGARKWDYLGVDVCEVCLAACIGCNPETVRRARRRKDKSNIEFCHFIIDPLKRKTGSGVRPAEKSMCAIVNCHRLGMRIIGRIHQMAEEEGNVMPNSNKTKLPYPAKKERLEEFKVRFSHRVASKKEQSSAPLWSLATRMVPIHGAFIVRRSSVRVTQPSVLYPAVLTP